MDPIMGFVQRGRVSVKTDDLVLEGAGEIDKAKRLVVEERVRRETECTREIQSLIDPVLKKYRCTLSPAVVFMRGKTQKIAIEAVSID